MTSPQRFYRSLDQGAPAPQFSLPAFPHGSAHLADHLGKSNLLLFFYARDFVGKHDFDGVSRTAAVSLSAISADAARFADAQTVILAISRGSLDSHAKLAALLDLKIPLLSDQSGDVGEQYGLLPENRWAGSSHDYDFSCCVVLVDKSGIVRHCLKTDLVMSPNHPTPNALRNKFQSGLRLRFGSPDALSTTELLRISEDLNR
jgi:thioredoxin-dependent peroxiredoxin